MTAFPAGYPNGDSLFTQVPIDIRTAITSILEPVTPTLAVTIAPIGAGS